MSSIGRKIAVGSPSVPAIAGGDDRLVMIQSNFSGSPSTYKSKTAHLLNSVWTLVEDEPSVSQFNRNVLKKLGGNLYRITANEDNDTQYVRGAVGQLERSSDEGATWLDVGPTPFAQTGDQHYGVADIDIGPDGTLWLCTGMTGDGDTGRIDSLPGSTVADPTTIITIANHNLTTGDEIIIEGHHSGAPDLDTFLQGAPYDPWTVTVTGAKTFTIPIEVTDVGSGGDWHRENMRARIFKSTPESGGLLWSEVFRDRHEEMSGSIDMYNSIACHPVNKDIIVVAGNSGIGIGRLLHTLDGGTTWTRKTPGNMEQATSSGRKIVIWDIGRVFHFMGLLAINGGFTEDYGATSFVQNGALEAARDHGNASYDFASTPSGLMFVIGGNVANPQVVRTKDYGTTWEEIFGGGTDFEASLGEMNGLAYDAQRDILYIASDDSNSSSGAKPRVRALDQASQVLASNVGSQTWRNLQLNLDTVFDDSIGHSGIEIL